MSTVLPWVRAMPGSPERAPSSALAQSVHQVSKRAVQTAGSSHGITQSTLLGALLGLSPQRNTDWAASTAHVPPSRSWRMGVGDTGWADMGSS